jgi:hypothetical protein
MSFNDPRNGWGASIADAMSTMLIMGGFDKEFAAAIKHFEGINFNQSYTSDTTSLFETTIRYVGGFLSAYELSGYKYPILVAKAKQITDKLVHGFDYGAVGVPYGFVNFATNQPTLSTSNVAEAGTVRHRMLTTNNECTDGICSSHLSGPGSANTPSIRRTHGSPKDLRSTLLACLRHIQVSLGRESTRALATSPTTML